MPQLDRAVATAVGHGAHAPTYTTQPILDIPFDTVLFSAYCDAVNERERAFLHRTLMTNPHSQRSVYGSSSQQSSSTATPTNNAPPVLPSLQELCESAGVFHRWSTQADAPRVHEGTQRPSQRFDNVGAPPLPAAFFSQEQPNFDFNTGLSHGRYSPAAPQHSQRFHPYMRDSAVRTQARVERPPERAPSRARRARTPTPNLQQLLRSDGETIPPLLVTASDRTYPVKLRLLSKAVRVGGISMLQKLEPLMADAELALQFRKAFGYSVTPNMMVCVNNWDVMLQPQHRLRCVATLDMSETQRVRLRSMFDETIVWETAVQYIKGVYRLLGRNADTIYPNPGRSAFLVLQGEYNGTRIPLDLCLAQLNSLRFQSEPPQFDTPEWMPNNIANTRKALPDEMLAAP